MKFGEYAFSKMVTLCFLGIGGLLFASASAFAGATIEIILIFVLLYILLILFWLMVSYLLERRKIMGIEKLIRELPEKYLLGEVLSRPTNIVERQYYHIMKEMSRSAVGVAEQAIREKEEYCDYVESWIHEIKTPLTACSLILANGGDVRKLKTELKRADNLTENILYYARMRTAEKDTQIKKFKVSAVIEEAVKSQMELLIASKIRVETQGDFCVYSDDKALCFMIKQFLINAAKYCPGCLIQITAEDGKITVKDNGIGIPAHELKRVTERGFTGTNGRKTAGSTGMGLYIVRELCEKLDIELKIESVQGSYTKILLAFRNLTKV